MPEIRAWGDLVVVLFEFLDDDTKLAQSCTDWLYFQHWYTVVPEPSMRVTLWALMGAGGNCHEHMQDAPPEPEIIDMPRAPASARPMSNLERCIALRLVYGAGPC